MVAACAALCRVALQFLQLVLDFQFLTLECRNHHVVVLEMGHLIVDLAFEFPMPPFEGSDMAFSRHDNSFQAFRTTRW